MGLAKVSHLIQTLGLIMNLSAFQYWVSKSLPQTTLAGVVAYNFNMAEPADGGWCVEIIGASSYNEDDPGWSCPPEAWTCRPDEYVLTRTALPTWELAQEFVFQEVLALITNATCSSAEVLRSAQAVCVAFVDGDHSKIWPLHVV